MSELPWTHEIEVATLPAEGRSFVLQPDEAAKQRLVKHADVLSIPDLSVRLEVRPTAMGAEVTGELSGLVRQRCVVSLDEFDNPVSERIEVDFATDPAAAATSQDADDGEDHPDPIIDGKIDLGALACEFLLLAVDPYPRKPGAVLPNLPGEASENAAGKSPFEALSGLKSGIKK